MNPGYIIVRGVFMRKYKNRKNKLLYISAAIILFALVCIVSVLSFTEKKIEKIISEDAEQKLSTIIYKEISSYLSENENIGELIHISYDKDGNIIGITTDSAAVNVINNELGARISKAVESLKDSKASFPIGAVSGIDILSGKGFYIDASYHSISNIETKLNSSFVECGINQTKHTLSINIRGQINAVMPGNDISITIDRDFLIAETVIVGKTPAVYLNNDQKLSSSP